VTKRLKQHELEETGNGVDAQSPETSVAVRWDEPGCITLRQDSPPEEWPTSLQVGSPAWKAALVNSALTPDLVIGNDWSEVYHVTDWLVSWRESVDEKTGEVRKYPWLTLFCANGTIVGTSSSVIPHELARMLRVFTPEEWAVGIGVRFRSRVNRAGNRHYHEMRVVT